MTKKQFEDQYPNYSGFIFLDSGYYLDRKLKESLDSLKIEYLNFKIDYLDKSFYRMVEPNIGPNLLYFKDGQYITKLDVFIGQEYLKKFINDMLEVVNS